MRVLEFFVLSFLVVILDAVPVDRSMMYGDHFQGDIKLTEEQREMLSGNSVNSKTGWTWVPYQWIKNAQGIVEIPFRFDHNAGFSECLWKSWSSVDKSVVLATAEMNFITNEFNLVNQVSCVRFVPYTNQPDYLEIISESGCWSWMGRMGGRQELSLRRNGCINQGTPVHEAIHAIGYDQWVV